MEICADCGKEKQDKDKAYTKLKVGGAVCEECANIRRAARDKKEPENELLEVVKAINGKLSFFMGLVIVGIILSFLGSCLGF